MLSLLLIINILSLTNSISITNLIDLPYDENDHLIDNWIMYKRVVGDENDEVCQDDVFLRSSNWLHHKDVEDLFHVGYLSDDDYKTLVDDDSGK